MQFLLSLLEELQPLPAAVSSLVPVASLPSSLTHLQLLAQVEEVVEVSSTSPPPTPVRLVLLVSSSLGHQSPQLVRQVSTSVELLVVRLVSPVCQHSTFQAQQVKPVKPVCSLELLHH